MGDANGDGRVDISDGVWIQRHAYAGGPRPACDAAVDILGEGIHETGNSVNIWSYLFTGAVADLGTHAGGGCEAWNDVGESPPCARAKLSFEVPGKAEGGSGEKAGFTAEVMLSTAGLEHGPDAWSFGVSADGCSVTTAATDGTAAADAFDDPPGQRDMGFAVAEVTGDGGAVSAVVLSWMEREWLTSEEDPVSVLQLVVEADAPQSGCGTCTLTFSDAMQGSGQPVQTVISLDGWSYWPTVEGATVNICAN